jgi:hypothetical protein
MRAMPRRWSVVLGIVLSAGLGGDGLRAQEPGQGQGQGQAPAGLDLPKTKPIPEFVLPELPTIPTRRGLPGPNWYMADTAALPKDPEGIWILEFAFKPVRVLQVDVPGKGRRYIHYLYYRVVNRTGAPRRFVPQFTLVTDDGQQFEDAVLPLAVKVIQAKEDPSKTLLGATDVIGTIPPSEKEGIDDAVYGVAIWDDDAFTADAFSVFVRGLSDGFQKVTPPEGGEPFTRFKAIRLDFARPGDERAPHTREIEIKDPPYEWVYYP